MNNTATISTAKDGDTMTSTMNAHIDDSMGMRDGSFNAMGNDNGLGDTDYLSELDALLGGDTNEIAQSEKVVLKQNLEGFASCFRDWDSRPPVR